MAGAPRPGAHVRTAHGTVALGLSPPPAPGRSLAGAAARCAGRRNWISGAPRGGRLLARAEAREGNLAVREPRRHDDVSLFHVHDRAPRRRRTRSQQLALRRAPRKGGFTHVNTGASQPAIKRSAATRTRLV